jgi:hypothetical protein
VVLNVHMIARTSIQYLLMGQLTNR